MNRLLTFLLSCSILLFSACKKLDYIQTDPLATLVVTNVVIGGKNVRLMSNRRDSALINNYKPFPVMPGLRQILLYPAIDSINGYYKQTRQFEDSGIYSLYLGGKPEAIDTVFMKENFPVYSDSAFGLRFVNMCLNSNPVNVVLSASPGVNEFSGIAYKGIAGFKKYQGLSSNINYVFRIRDAVTDALIASYTLATPRFNNVTLVLKGQIGGTGTSAPGIVRVNNY